jgi:syntaxin-binding protein 1
MNKVSHDGRHSCLCIGMRISLLDIAKKRIVDELFGSIPGQPAQSDIESGTRKRHFVLVLDLHTLKIVSSVCRRYDLSERGAIFIEQIEKQRQPFPDLDVVYFLTPSSIPALLSDHSASPLYADSHCFFTSKLNDAMFSRLTGNRVFSSRCKNLVEMNLDFICYNSRVFYCDNTNSISRLSLPKADDIEEKIVREHVDSLVSVCASLREKPVIRYMGKSAISRRIAASFRSEIDSLQVQLPNKGTTVLIVDRSIETGPLFVHDMYYEGLALDVLDGLDADGGGLQWALATTTDTATSVSPTFEYKTITGKGIEENRKVLISEISDPLWAKYKYEHFRVVSDMIRAELGELAGKASLGSSSSVGATSNPLETLRKLPEYQDKISKLSVHIELSKKLIEVFDKLKLMEVIRIEQELLTGIDDDGREILLSKLYSSLGGTMAQLGPEERLRLVLLYLSQVDDIAESTVEELVSKIGRLDSEFAGIVSKFLSLKITGTLGGIGPDGAMPVAPKRGSVAPIVQSNRHTIKIDKAAIKRHKAVAKKSKFVNCRYESELSSVVDACLRNSLDSSLFPNIGGTGTSQYVSVAPPQTDVDGSVATGGAGSWAAAALAEQSSPTAVGQNQKLILLVVGGITLMETREMEEIGLRHGIDIIAGGSCILTAKRFIEIVTKL